jgi:hypothetical protein
VSLGVSWTKGRVDRVPTQTEGGSTMKYLVVGSGGPGFATPEEALEILQDVILPGFTQLIELQKNCKKEKR